MDVDLFAKAVRGKIRTELNDLADTLANGRAQSYDEYKRICGVIHGLAMAEGFLDELAKLNEEQE